MKWSLQAKKALLNANIKKQPLPRLWLPTDQKQIVIEAWYNDSKIARFGITIQPGPPAPAIVETIETIYGETDQSVMNCAAIIFMFVEPDYRARNLGTLALELISYIHATQGADYTVLVADDKDNGKLVKWYQAHGYSLAPKLQDFFGSPNQIYGITMIGPTNYELSDDCNIEW
jgi:GNAT superfamily N-acetyltransferase